MDWLHHDLPTKLRLTASLFYYYILVLADFFLEYLIRFLVVAFCAFTIILFSLRKRHEVRDMLHLRLPSVGIRRL
jgi:hypothetical protein